MDCREEIKNETKMFKNAMEIKQQIKIQACVTCKNFTPIELNRYVGECELIKNFAMTHALQPSSGGKHIFPDIYRVDILYKCQGWAPAGG